VKAFRIGGGGHPIFDGAGAEIHGGRWNSPGRRCIYAGGSFAIAMLERLVYSGIGRTPRGDRFVEIDIPDDLIEILDAATLPGWDHPGRAVAMAHGDLWYADRRSVALSIPSAVTKIDRNIAINQNHPDFARIVASVEQPVRWDDRLFRRPSTMS
jgi:RES domain-containing protein